MSRVMRAYQYEADLWVPTAPVVTGTGGAVSVASYRKLASKVPADLFPIYGSDRRRLQVSTVADLSELWLYSPDLSLVPAGSTVASPGSVNVPPNSIVVLPGAGTIGTPVATKVVARPVTVVPDLLPLRGHRCAPGTNAGGVVRAIVAGITLTGGQITPNAQAPTAIINVTISSIEQDVGVKERLEESWQLAWDATVETRAGGTIYAFTLSSVPVPGTIVDVYRQGIRMVYNVDYTLASNLVTFLDGAKPILSEIVTVEYTPS